MPRNQRKIKKTDGISRVKRLIFGVLLYLVSVILIFSFFEKAGIGGRLLFESFRFLFGNAVFLIPLFLVILGWIFSDLRYQEFSKAVTFSISLLLFGISGLLGVLGFREKLGGWLGFLLGWPLLKLFGSLVTEIIFGVIILASILIAFHLFRRPSVLPSIPEEKQPFFSRIFKKVKRPKLRIKEVEPTLKPEVEKPELKTEPIFEEKILPLPYQPPPLNLLEVDKETPNSGDVRNNSAIIKKTLENFDIKVEMGEINIGPTVTQYTLRPAEGIKLSRITSLSNNLALALASHPIRIEAPIPGKSLVGIEVPNKVRAKVRLRNLLENPGFQNSPSNLTFTLGRDVSGSPVYADLAKMPHLLVAGSTGTGKTIFLNSLIISLLYRNSPRILRFILVDPKRVEFPVYDILPHLLSPVVLNVEKTVLVLKWLTKEMERRFEVLAEAKVRDVASYNRLALSAKTEPLPYIVLIVDELADLMAAKGKEIEAGIVRLAQLARAVGIHLVVATQRPSVEVITGLIKANITSRVSCQVASQIDSRTVLDMAGAEKLLGLGDMLFISAEISKPKRIQGAYVSQKEVKKVVKWINSKYQKEIEPKEDKLAQALGKDLIYLPKEETQSLEFEEDPLYEEAKRIVIEARKASASLLQRKLRIGYARAARIIDMLEERGVIGPFNGAKPREVYLKKEEYPEI